ncbi:hypothetical protein C8F01DRAFT_963396, partial [Mycena amicta]
ETQAQLVSAICALHNFIRVYDEDDEAEAEDDDEEDGNMNTQGQPPQISPEELGMSISAAERNRAPARRDAIARHMWADYKAYM